MKKISCFLLVFIINITVNISPTYAVEQISKVESLTGYDDFLSQIEDNDVSNNLAESVGIADDYDYNRDAELFATSVSGTCGDNLTWELSAVTQTLTISGTGAMDDYTNTSDIPWYSLKDYVTILDVGEGVTTIGAGAFYMCTCLTRITFPSSLTTIKENALRKSRILCKVLNKPPRWYIIKILNWRFYLCQSTD